MTSLIWELDQQNRIAFVMIDGSGGEVAGLAGSLSLEISKDGGALVASGGTDGEIGSGWYWYLSTAGEADTIGPVAIRVTAPGAIQQNLEYVVRRRNVQGITVTYTVTNSVSGLPVSGALVTVTTDIAGDRIVFTGVTDTFGVLRDTLNAAKPVLDPGPYYFWTQKPGLVFTNPDLENVA